MSRYRAVVNYRFKSGMEHQAMKFLENELMRKGDSYGCHNIEILQSELDPTHVLGVALWNDIQDARRFQARWAAKEHELVKMCSEAPKREFFKIATSFAEHLRKAA